MIPTRDQVAAFADGQLQGEEAAEVAAAIAADPSLKAEVSAHRALRERLSRHFAPVPGESVPSSLTALLSPSAPVVDLASVRASRRAIPRWTWIAAPALAASLVLAVVVDKRREPQEGYAGDQIASALDTQLVSEQRPDASVRVLLSFRDNTGSYCRAFSRSGTAGIACRDENGWKLHAAGTSEAARGTEYRQAGSDVAIMQAAQEMAAGPALDAVAEREAKMRGWLR